VGNAQEEPPTPLEYLNRLSHGQQEEPYYYPATLNYGVPKDMCMWQAFLNNEIKSEECSAALKFPMYYSNFIVLHILPPFLTLFLTLFLTGSYYCYAIASEIGLSPRSKTAVVFGPLLVSVLFIHVTYPLLTTLAGGAAILVLAMKAASCILTGLMSVLTITMICIPSEDEEEKHRCCDSENGYRRMGDDETVLYVAVPLQVV
jgi:hypothetical protein